MKSRVRRKGRSRSKVVSVSPWWDPLYNKETGLDGAVCVAVVVVCLYVCVTLRAFWSLPAIPPNLLANSKLSASDFHRSYQHVTSVAAEMLAHEHNRHAFPISVSDRSEWQSIPHPGVQFSDRALEENEVVTLEVPPFWDPQGYGEGGVRQFLGQHGDRLMTLEEALSVGSVIPLLPDNPQGPMLETIYVAISSYRDAECSNTVESVFGRAKYPQRIRVAIVEQRDDSANDPICTNPIQPCSVDPHQALCRFTSQIDRYEMDASLAIGPVFARHVGHRMYRGEYFAMQNDAHVSFVQDWDDSLVQQWRSSKNEMAVLTAYLSDVIGSIDPITGKSNRDSRPIMCNTDYEGSGLNKHLRHGQQPEGVPQIHVPMLEPYWAAGFSFSRGHFVVQVPYDQYLPMIFQGEEISLGVRGFTYGYDYYTAEHSVCFHMYAVGENEAKRHKVKLFWENASRYPGAEVKAMLRLNGIIDLRIRPGDWDHTEEDTYGIGKVRTVSKFYDTFGIHIKEQKVEHHLCRFVGIPMMREFLPHLRPNTMGINYDEIDYQFVDPDPDHPQK